VSESNRPRISRDSHYVPQALIRQWSHDGSSVLAYRTLVSSPRVPLWTSRSIKGVAFRRDLYTQFAGGLEQDEFETWLANEIEHPGLEAVSKLIDGRQLTPSDWHRIVRLVAAQDVRTPLSYLELMTLLKKNMPTLMKSIPRESVKRLEALAANREANVRTEKPNELSGLFNVKVEDSGESESEFAQIRCKVKLGREFWIATMRHWLTGVAEVLCRHHWSVIYPAGASEWPFSDHPVLRLNYFGPKNYDFGGGWGKPGSELMMPVSPRHLLYAKVGSKAVNRMNATVSQTVELRWLLAQRAHRWIFCRSAEDWVAQARPRIEDNKKFTAEEAAWKMWRRLQSDSDDGQEGGTEAAC